MTTPTVSIIVPVYKVERYLRECVDSVLSQTYTDFELLLVDDGSPDASGAICDEYAGMDSRVRVFHKGNGGLSSARNHGMERAMGKWTVFIDSDDMWGDCTGLEKLVNEAEKRELDLLRFEYRCIDEQSDAIESGQHKSKNISGGVMSNYNLVRDAIAGEWFAWLFLLRTEAIEGMRFDEDCKFQEDIDFYCRLLASRELRCGYCGEQIYLYRKRGNSLTSSVNVDNLAGSCRLCEVFYGQSQLTDDTRLQRLYLYYSVMMYYWTLGTLSENPYFASRKDIIGRLGLVELRKRTHERMADCDIDFKYYPFLLTAPATGVTLLRLKNKVVRALKRFI